VDSTQVADLQHNLLEKLIDEKVMLLAAAAESIDVKESDVMETAKEQMDQLQKNFPTRDALEKEMQKSLGLGLTQYESNLRQEVREKLVTVRLQQKIRGQMQITKAEVEKFFAQYRDSLPPTGPSVNLSHIMLNLQADSAVAENVRLFIQNIHQELQQGLPFLEAVAKYSQSPDTAGGGDLGFIAKGELGDPVFEAAAFNLELQTYSRPFRSRLGYHIIYLEERKDRKVRVRHILRLVDFTPDDTLAAWKKADSIGRQVKDSASFASLARQFSADPATAYKGGFLGWFTQEELKEDYKTGITDLEAGSCSPVVRIRDSYHIFRLNAKVGKVSHPRRSSPPARRAALRPRAR
jgi:peptidyl-prolyl cis-trans isomerase SurA